MECHAKPRRIAWDIAQGTVWVLCCSIRLTLHPCTHSLTDLHDLALCMTTTAVYKIR